MKRMAVLLLLIVSLVLTGCTSSADKGGKENDGADVTTDVRTTTDSDLENTPPKALGLRVATYNVKHFQDVDHDFSIIARDILLKNHMQRGAFI